MAKVEVLKPLLHDGVSYDPDGAEEPIILDIPGPRAKRLLGKKAVRIVNPDELLGEEELAEEEKKPEDHPKGSRQPNRAAAPAGNQQAVSAPTQGAK